MLAFVLILFLHFLTEPSTIAMCGVFLFVFFVVVFSAAQFDVTLFSCKERKRKGGIYQSFKGTLRKITGECIKPLKLMIMWQNPDASWLQGLVCIIICQWITARILLLKLPVGKLLVQQKQAHWFALLYLIHSMIYWSLLVSNLSF